jgi:hypothetical protein
LETEGLPDESLLEARGRKAEEEEEEEEERTQDRGDVTVRKMTAVNEKRCENLVLLPQKQS